MRQVVRNGLFLGAGQAVSKASLLLLALAIANLLGPVAFGEAVTGFTLATFLRNVLDWGLAKIAVRHVSRRPPDAGAFLAAALRSKGILVAAAFPLYGAAAVYFAGLADHPWGMGVFLALMGAAQVVEAAVLARGYVFNGLERMDLEMAGLAVRQVLGLGVSVGGILAGWGLPAVGLGVFLGEVAAWAWTGRCLARLGVRAKSAAGPSRAREIRRAGAPIAVGVLCGLVYHYANTLILRVLLGPESTGLYNAAYRIVVEFQVIPTVLSAAAFPLFARLGEADSGDVAGLLRRARRAAAALLAAGGAAAMLLAVFSGEVLRILYPVQPEFWTMATMLAVLAASVPLACLNVLLGDVLYALDGERTAVAIALTVAGMSLVANLLAIPRWGLWGACFVSVGAEALFLVLDLLAVRVLAGRRRRRGALPGAGGAA